MYACVCIRTSCISMYTHVSTCAVGRRTLHMIFDVFYISGLEHATDKDVRGGRGGGGGVQA